MYSRNQITLSSLTLHTAAISTAWSWLGSPWNNQAELHLFQKHILCWEYIHSHSYCGHFWNKRKTPGGTCSVLRLSSACFFFLYLQLYVIWSLASLKCHLKFKYPQQKKVRKAACSSSLNGTGKVLMTQISARVHYNDNLCIITRPDFRLPV